MSDDARHILVVSLTDRRARFAQASRHGNQVRIDRRSTLALPEGVTLDQPGKLSEAIQAHLKQEGYTSRAAVVGVSSRWVMARYHKAPPVDDAALRGIARLQAERDAAGLADQLTYDYQEVSGNHASRELLLVAVQHKRLDAVRAVMQAAGLQLRRVMPTALSCGHDADHALTLLLQDGMVSVMEARAGGWVSLSAFTTGTDQLDTPDDRKRFAATLARHMMTLPPAQREDGGTLRLLDTLGLDDAARAGLKRAIEAKLGSIEIEPADDTELIARATLTAPDAQVNLIASRLDQPEPRRLSKRVRWGGGAAAAVLLITLGVAGLWFWQLHQLNTMRAEHDAIAEQATHLETILDDTRAASGWFDDRLPVLDCLLALTEAFPTQQRVWVTQFRLDDQLVGTLECRAQDQDAMLAYLDALRDSPSLSGVELRDWQETGRDPRLLTFQIGFRYQPGAAGGAG